MGQPKGAKHTALLPKPYYAPDPSMKTSSVIKGMVMSICHRIRMDNSDTDNRVKAHKKF